MLTTSENNYKRSLFSFQRSCINQIVTQSIGIHLKRKMRVVKKENNNNPKQMSSQLKLERRHMIVRSGFRTIKKPRTTTRTPYPGSLCSSAASTNHPGEASPPQHISLSPFSQSTNGQDDDFSTILSLSEVASSTQKGCGGCKER